MASGQGGFDIQIKRENRWITEATREQETDARGLAKKLLSDPKCAGARVVAIQLRRDGTHHEKVIFEETQSASGEKPVRIVPIDSAQPYCKTAKDFFGLESRMTINRLFREYLESVLLTPTEVLHNYKQLQRLFDRDGLLLSSTSHVAALQVKGTQTSSKARQAEINTIIDHIVAQAKHAQTLKLPPPGCPFCGYPCRRTQGRGPYAGIPCDGRAGTGIDQNSELDW